MIISHEILYALIAGGFLALAAGPLGCFIVWRRMAYLGDSLSHSGLLGIALGIAGGIGANLGTLIICTIFAVFIVLIERRKLIATDTLLGILAHAALSVGMVTIALVNINKQEAFDHQETGHSAHNIDVHDHFFGNLLAISDNDLFWIVAGSIIVTILIALLWRRIIIATISSDLAQAEGINIIRLQLILLFLVALVVAFSIKIIGILLITSLLIIPAASARLFAKSPTQMAVMAILFGISSVTIGLFGSLHFGVDSGPAIVVAATILFLASLPYALIRSK